MGNYLLFQLYGQMAACGGTAVGEERPTTKTPGKSSLAGLLGAALGIRREEHDRLAPLWEHYYMAVREDREGLLLIDYHTVQDPNLSARERLPFTRREALAHSKVNTVVTLREYLMEGAWMVCWWPSVAAPAYELEELAEALRRPKLTPYLGRKSCSLALPMAPHVVESSDWYAALSQAPSVDPGQFLPGRMPGEPEQRDPSRLDSPRYRWDAAAGEAPPELGPVVEESKLDLPVHRGRWQFTRRAERMAQPRLEG